MDCASNTAHKWQCGTQGPWSFLLVMLRVCCLTWGYVMSWSHLQTLWLEFAYVLCRCPVIPTTNRISIFYMSWSGRQWSPPSPPPDTDEPQGMATLVPYTGLTDRSRRSKKPHSWSHILRFSLCVVHLTPSWWCPPRDHSHVHFIVTWESGR